MHFLPHYPAQLWPPAASAMAGEIDTIFAVWCVVLFMLVAPVFVFMAYCAVKYRAGRPADREHREARNIRIEMTWMIVPFLITLVFFFWAGTIYLQENNPPPNAMEITALGRQWMWKFQHPGGQAEINDLHVPVGVPIRVNIESQDVVHSLYIPALRLQEEAVPGRTTELWFKADRTGAYNLNCSELCGADHALMAGTLYVMSASGYQNWLKQAGATQTLAAAGKQLFDSYGCSGCHTPNSTVRAPSLAGLYGQVVPLQDGTTVVATDAYIRDSILEPKKQVVAGFKPVMPSFAGTIPDEDMQKIVAYVESLGGSQQTP
ncbi:MAG TPA: cytochrome c oxidase subunit II [Rhodopila sp.]|nr:cytochrome c oxidase subunit II [Rhodopila sp.]